MIVTSGSTTYSMMHDLHALSMFRLQMEKDETSDILQFACSVQAQTQQQAIRVSCHRLPEVEAHKLQFIQVSSFVTQLKAKEGQEPK
jgi:hypothetical protein